MYLVILSAFKTAAFTQKTPFRHQLINKYNSAFIAVRQSKIYAKPSALNSIDEEFIWDLSTCV